MLDMFNSNKKTDKNKSKPKQTTTARKARKDEIHVLISMLKNLKQKHYVSKRLSKTRTTQLYNRIMKVHTELMAPGEN